MRIPRPTAAGISTALYVLPELSTIAMPCSIGFTHTKYISPFKSTLKPNPAAEIWLTFMPLKLLFPFMEAIVADMGKLGKYTKFRFCIMLFVF